MRQIITSSRNELIQDVRRLQKTAERRRQKLAILDGRKLLEEALSCSLTVRKVLVQQEKEDLYAQVLRQAEEAGALILLVPRSLIDSISDVPSSQGIVSVCAFPEEKKLQYPLTALCGIQDPGNVGTILRTAEAAGFGGVLLDRDCADVFSQKTLRSAMGSAFRMPVKRVEELSSVLGELRDLDGAEVLSSALDGTPFYQRGKDKVRSILVIGSEGHGISPEVSRVSTQKLRLPMAGRTESLNAASAASIMLYDIARNLFFSETEGVPRERPFVRTAEIDGDTHF